MRKDRLTLCWKKTWVEMKLNEMGTQDLSRVLLCHGLFISAGDRIKKILSKIKMS